MGARKLLDPDEKSTSEPDSLGAEEFHFFQEELFRRTGVSIPESKSSLIESRLRRPLQELGLQSFREYRELLEGCSWPSPPLQTFVNCLTTHTTEWFREIEHFHELEQFIIPEWCKKNSGKTFRIWSAACSTGEEPYSLALLCHSLARKYLFEFEIFATDIDTSVLEKAREAKYSEEDLARIPKNYHHGALSVGQGASEGLIRIQKHLRDRVRFAQLNLSEGPYKVPGPFHLILCRNVLIYFPSEVIESVSSAMYQVADQGAYLLTGHSESFSNLRVPWEMTKPTFYRKKEGA